MPPLPVLLALVALTALGSGELSASPPCRDAVGEAVELAARGALEEAGSVLESARLRCPRDPALLRELAGIRFREGRRTEARSLAELLVTLEPDEGWGWELLGTLAYLDDDARGALRAWNRAGRPRVDADPAGGTGGAVTLSGLGAREAPALWLGPGDLVTPESLLRARRRLEALPSVARARVDYRPTPGGGARIEGAVTRHPPHTLTRGALPGHLVRALGGRLEVTATDRVARGEQVRLSALLDGGFRGGTLSVLLPQSGGRWGGSWEGELLHRTIRPGWDPELRLARSGARLRLHPWPGARLRGSIGVGGDRWAGQGSRAGGFAAVEGAGEVGLGASWLLRAELQGWSGGFGRSQVGASGSRTLTGPAAGGEAGAVTSGPAEEAGRPRATPGWTLGVQGSVLSLLGDAPLELAPRFGSRRSATHAMRGAATLLPPGRHWGHGSVEVTWLRRAPASLLLGGALFLDGVRALGAASTDPASTPSARSLGETSSPRHALHAGGGLRVGVPGVDGWLRLDLAIPLEAGSEGRGARHPHISVAWVSP